MKHVLLHVTTVPQSLLFLRGQIGAMKQKGFDVHVVSSPGPILQQFSTDESVETHVIAMHRRITPTQDIISILRLLWLLKRISPSIVDAHTPKAGLIAMVSAFLARTPVRIYHLHGLRFMTAAGRKRSLLRLMEKLSCRLANEVLCVSHSIRDFAIEDGLCEPEKIRVLLGGSINGVDAVSRFNPDRFSREAIASKRHILGISSDALVLGFVGRIVRDKGIVELSVAWRNLREIFPNLHLIIIGPIEPEDPVPEEVLDGLRSDDRVCFVGENYDTPILYAVMDIVVLPTYREGFPNVPLEAASMAVPVVATRIPGCIDAVQDGVTGTLIPPRNTTALVASIRDYLDDPQLRREHGQAGRSRVLREFQREALWEELYREYCRLLVGKGAQPPEFSDSVPIA